METSGCLWPCQIKNSAGSTSFSQLLKSACAVVMLLIERQTRRLMNRFRESGAAGLANLRRGRPGNNRLPESLKLRVLSLVHEHYSDFGPTLAAEKLRERHNIKYLLKRSENGWQLMDSGFLIHVADPAFINPDTDVTASENLFRLMVLRMTGLKVEGRNAACSSLLMTRQVAWCTFALVRLNEPLITWWPLASISSNTVRPLRSTATSTLFSGSIIIRLP